MKATLYFQATRQRSDRSWILDEWICRVIQSPDERATQSDGRVRLWKRIAEADDRWLRVILLDDGETVHIENVYIDVDESGELVAMTIEHAKESADIANLTILRLPQIVAA